MIATFQQMIGIGGASISASASSTYTKHAQGAWSSSWRDTMMRDLKNFASKNKENLLEAEQMIADIKAEVYIENKGW